jgi:hypothetical protein
MIDVDEEDTVEELDEIGNPSSEASRTLAYLDKYLVRKAYSLVADGTAYSNLCILMYARG